MSSKARTDESLEGRPGGEREFVTAAGETLRVPDDWELLPPGDATVTRRVKASGPTWLMTEKRGRKVFSRGLWADAARIATVRAEVEAERDTPEYARRLAAGRARRAKAEEEYGEAFQASVVQFLDFDDRYADLAVQLAEAVTEHATPVGSGTVARTKRIPVEERAERAVIAWMRHQTTAYDRMHIERSKGRRREVRRELARRSRQLLEGYRRGNAPRDCPLRTALEQRRSPPESD